MKAHDAQELCSAEIDLPLYWPAHPATVTADTSGAYHGRWWYPQWVRRSRRHLQCWWCVPGQSNRRSRRGTPLEDVAPYRQTM